jgi:protein-S-isoprenylcysteine O-methyltransferase Ste14
MTAAWLGFSIASTAYFVVGSLLEEHKMRRVYGEVYQVYQEHVPWMVPFLKFNTPSGKRVTASEQFPD